MGARILIIFFLALHLHAYAQTASSSDTSLFKPDIFCQRSYIYKSRTYPVDSSRKQDGEGLRFVFKNHAPAETLLNDYQNDRKSISKWPAYIGTLGALGAIGGFIYAGTMKDITLVEQRNIRFAFIAGGLLVVYGSYHLGQRALHANEKKLEKAIETYNDAVPEPERIRVGIAPAPSGAEVKTQVTF